MPVWNKTNVDFSPIASLGIIFSTIHIKNLIDFEEYEF